MTNEQINIAIAESLGIEPTLVEWWAWKDDGDGGRICMSSPIKDHVEKWLADNPVYAKGFIAKPFYRYPNYTADLNACHEFEKTLDDDLDLDYSENLESVTGSRWGANNSYDMSKYRSATACQRCEAYLRTIGKWLE